MAPAGVERHRWTHVGSKVRLRFPSTAGPMFNSGTDAFGRGAFFFPAPGNSRAAGKGASPAPVSTGRRSRARDGHGRARRAADILHGRAVKTGVCNAALGSIQNVLAARLLRFRFGLRHGFSLLILSFVPDSASPQDGGRHRALHNKTNGRFICREARRRSVPGRSTFSTAKEALIAGISERDRQEFAERLEALAGAPDFMQALRSLREQYFQ
jgi:hypothetical protein